MIPSSSDSLYSFIKAFPVSGMLMLDMDGRLSLL